jgi:hypothetical protein
MLDEWAFNKGAGFTEKDDVMPDCMKQDAIGPVNWVWDVPQDIVRTVYERFEPTEELYTNKPG